MCEAHGSCFYQSSQAPLTLRCIPGSRASRHELNSKDLMLFALKSSKLSTTHDHSWHMTCGGTHSVPGGDTAEVPHTSCTYVQHFASSRGQSWCAPA